MEEISRRYRLLNKIAEGNSGIVYCAQDLSLSRQVAIKVLKAELHQDQESRERFRREILASNLLTHPSAVKIYEQGQLVNGNPWLAMELLEGITLEEKLERGGPLSQEEFFSVMAPVCELLEEAHTKGILHRDLKAHHILIDEHNMSPRVIDFGLALLRDAETLTKSDMMAGTPQYMPPEQWDGLHMADARSDIYALGMISYQALAGHLPFEADSLFEWMKKHFHEAPLALSIAIKDRPLLPFTERAIMKAIEKDPNLRQQSIHEFKLELFGDS
jgi:serine/threonine protein kinase